MLEIIWLKTRDATYFHHYEFWTRLLLINIAMGVVAGIVMEFQFGTNWSRFSKTGGDIIGEG